MWAPIVNRLIGLAAVAFSMVYFASDVLELAQGGFSTPQLALTYAGEAPIPLFVLGLYAVQRPRIAWWGLAAAVAYAYVFVFFAGTVVYTILERTPDFAALQDQFGAWMTVHSVLMIVAGIGLGAAVLRAGVFPRWTGAALIVGMILIAVASVLPVAAQTAAAGVRDLAFAGMGWALLSSRRPALSPTAAK